MPKLTKRTAESAKAQEKDYFIWDNELPGLGLRVYTSGKRSYVIHYRFAGRSRRFTIGLAADGSKYSKGIIDIAVLFDWERERYLAYECKRLNVINGGNRSSLATVYVTQGMMRFLTEQYAERLPVGCMIGYVLDGDVPFARSRIADAIGGHVPLALAEGPTPLAAIETIERFRTRHTRPTGSQIELRHALFSKPSSAAPTD